MPVFSLQFLKDQLMAHISLHGEEFILYYIFGKYRFFTITFRNIQEIVTYVGILYI